MITTRKIIAFGILWLICASAHGQTDLEKLSAIEKEFYLIDEAVFLMEEIPVLNLTNDLDKIILLSLEQKNPNYKNQLKKLHQWLACLENTYAPPRKTFGLIVSAYVDSKIKTIPIFSNLIYDDRIHQLYHHTKRLFENIGRDEGNVFDENLVNIYYQFRNELRQIIETEKMKYELTHQISGLKVEISMLCDAINSVKLMMNRKFDSLKKTTDTTRKFSEDQQRDERVSQLLTRRKWRYAGAIKLSKQKLDSIILGKDLKVARKDLKRALK